MDRSVVSKAHMALVVGFAGLLSVGVAFYHSAHMDLFYFEVMLHSSLPGTSQVFYDLGRGINQTDSACLPTPLADSMIVARFPLPSGTYKMIRFDPIDHGYSSVAFRDARIKDFSGRVIRTFSVQDFQSPLDIGEMHIRDETITLDLGEANHDSRLTIDLTPSLALYSSRASLLPFTARTFAFLFCSLCAAALCWLSFVPRRWSSDILLLTFLATFVFLFARSRFLAPICWDEELFVWQGWMVKRGQVPYRDFVEPKPPLIFFANALGLALFGLKDTFYRILPTALAVGSILLFHLAMLRRRVLPWLVTLLTAQVALWLLGGDFHDTSLNDTETYGFAFTLAGFSLGLLSRRVTIRSRRMALQVISGICFGLAISSKELFLASAIPAWLLAARPEDCGKWDWRQLLFSGVGVILVGVSTIAYLISQSTLSAYLDLIRFYRPLAANYCLDIGRFPRVSGLAVLRPAWAVLYRNLYNLPHLAFVLPLMGACFVLLPWRARVPTRIIELGTAIAAVLLGMITVSWGYCFWKHYFLMGTTGLLLLSVIGAEVLSHFLSQSGKIVSRFALVGLSALFLFVASAPIRTAFAEKYVPQRVSVDPRAVRAIEAHSKPGDYILVTDTPLIYVVTNRREALGICGWTDYLLPYMEDNPALQIATLRDRLEMHLPKICYFSRALRPRQELFHKLLFEPLLAKHSYVKVNDQLWYLPEQ